MLCMSAAAMLLVHCHEERVVAVVRQCTIAIQRVEGYLIVAWWHSPQSAGPHPEDLGARANFFFLKQSTCKLHPNFLKNQWEEMALTSLKPPPLASGGAAQKMSVRESQKINLWAAGFGKK